MSEEQPIVDATIPPPTTKPKRVVATLDEPVYKTIWRDLRLVLIKLFHVLVPRVWSHKSKGVHALREWDLWGPLLISLMLSLTLYFTTTQAKSVVFATAFVLPWLGGVLVTLNSVLLGGTMSFFQSVCLIGYCVFPLALAAIATRFWKNIIFRAVVTIVCFLWSTLASVGFFAGLVPPNRKALAVYPVLLMYLVVGWMIMTVK